MQMDHKDKAFKSTWKDGVLILRMKSIQDNTFNLMKIIIEAAVEHDRFNMAIDARELEPLSFRQMWAVGKFASEVKYKIDQYVGKLSFVLPRKYHRTVGLIMRFAGPNCEYYITENVKDAKQFLI